jgi:hypothetical protein
MLNTHATELIWFTFCAQVSYAMLVLSFCQRLLTNSMKLYQLEKSAVEIQKWKQKVVEIQDRYFIILLFTLQLLDSVFKYNCGIKKFEKIMVNKCQYIEFTKLL